MPDEALEIPEHLSLFADEISSVVAEIRESFINRPSPSTHGTAGLDEFRSILNNWLDRLKRCVQEIIREFNGPLSSAMADGEKKMIMLSVQSLQVYINEMAHQGIVW